MWQLSTIFQSAALQRITTSRPSDLHAANYRAWWMFLSSHPQIIAYRLFSLFLSIFSVCGGNICWQFLDSKTFWAIRTLFFSPSYSCTAVKPMRGLWASCCLHLCSGHWGGGGLVTYFCWRCCLCVVSLLFQLLFVFMSGFVKQTKHHYFAPFRILPY